MRNSKKILFGLVFTTIIVGFTLILNYLLVPNSIVRVQLHNLRSQKYDDIFVGTSHGLSAINPEIVDEKTGRNSINLCWPDEHLIDSYYIIKEACRVNKPSRIIYELDSSYWSTPQNKGANAVYIYNHFPNSKVKMEYYFDKILEMDMRVTLAPWFYYRNEYKNIPHNLTMKRSKEYQQYNVSSLEMNKAQVYNQDGFLYQTVVPETDRGNLNFIMWDEKKIQDIELQYFKKIVKYCKEQKIELIAITTPVSRETLEKYPHVYESANRYFTQLMSTWNVEYYNFNTLSDEQLDRSVMGYVDYEGHLSGELGNKFSAILGKILRTGEK